MNLDANKQWCANHLLGLKWKGNKGIGRCPLPTHGGPDNHPSLSVEAELGVFHCFSENKSGPLRILAEEMGWDPPPEPNLSGASGSGRVVAEYEYRDVNGTVVYVVERKEPKAFVSKRPDGAGGFIYNTTGVEPIPFRLPELHAAQQERKVVFIPEGEKDVETLYRLGYTATCNHSGAGKWDDTHSRWFKKGTEVVILPDNDNPGHKHAIDVGRRLLERGCRVKIVVLPGLQEKGDVTDWIQSGRTKEELEKEVIESKYLSHADIERELAMLEFEPDADFPMDGPDLPRFPTKALPKVLADFVEAEAEAVQVPEDLVAMMVLPAAALSVAGKAEVCINDGYQEPLNLYVVSVQEPGTRKSRVAADVSKPIQDYERERQLEAKIEIAKAKAHKESLQMRLDVIKSKMKNPKLSAEGQEALQPQLERLMIELEQSEIPAFFRLLTDNCTSERMATMLAEQGGCIASLSPEGTMFETMFGRYSRIGVDIDIFLRGHSGDPLIVDRQSDRQGGAPVIVPKPAITLGLAIQPQVLIRIGREDDFKGRGLLGRFAYSYPRDLVGHRKVVTTPVPASVVNAFHVLITALLSIKKPKDPENNKLIQPHKITLSKSAEARRVEFAEKVEQMLGSEGQLFYMRDWGGKLPGLVSRIAGVLHLAEKAQEKAPWESPIGEDTYAKAVCIGEYLIPHAQAAYGLFAEDPRQKTARQIMDWAIRKGIIRVSRRDLFIEFRNNTNFKNVAALKEILGFMEGNGYVKQIESGNPGARKKSVHVWFNPYVLERNRHQARSSMQCLTEEQSAESTQSAQLTQSAQSVDCGEEKESLDAEDLIEGTL